MDISTSDLQYTDGYTTSNYSTVNVTNTTDDRHGIPILFFTFGSLGLTVVVIITVSLIILCYVLYRRKHKNRPNSPHRLISNNDFNLRISDVLDVDKNWHSPWPGKPRRSAYFRQESYEATRFDRTYAVPNVQPFVQVPDDGLTGQPNNDYHNDAIRQQSYNDENNETELDKTLQEESAERNNIMIDGMKNVNAKIENNYVQSPILQRHRQNEYQVPKTPQLNRVVNTHYQVPRGHYQTPKSSIGKTNNYHVPRKVTSL